MKELVKLPSCSPPGTFEYIDHSSVAAIVYYNDARTLVYRHGESEGGGINIALTQEETAKRLGLKLVDSVEPPSEKMSLGQAIEWMMMNPGERLVDSDGDMWLFNDDETEFYSGRSRRNLERANPVLPIMLSRTFEVQE
jgi:hypothetical protein